MFPFQRVLKVQYSKDRSAENKVRSEEGIRTENVDAKTEKGYLSFKKLDLDVEAFRDMDTHD